MDEQYDHERIAHHEALLASRWQHDPEVSAMALAHASERLEEHRRLARALETRQSAWVAALPPLPVPTGAPSGEAQGPEEENGPASCAGKGQAGPETGDQDLASEPAA